MFQGDVQRLTVLEYVDPYKCSTRGTSEFKIFGMKKCVNEKWLEVKMFRMEHV